MMMGLQSFLAERIQRYKAFYADKEPGNILVQISPYTFNIDYSHLDLNNKPLYMWDIESEAESIIDNQIRKVRYFNEYTKDLDNDYIPIVTSGLGVGVNSSFLVGNEVRFGIDTSWTQPAVFEWDDLDKLSFDKDNYWVRILKRMAKHSVNMCDGEYAVITFSHFAPSDMANALRGNQLFYDFYDYQEQVHKLMDISADAVIALERELKTIVPDVMGGSVAAYAWMPGHALYMSEDAADLCAPEIYRKYCRSYTQKVIDAIGGAHIHHHGKGMHVHSEIAKLRNLHFVEISWDPNCPRPIDNLEKLIDMNPELPIMTRCTVEDVYEKIDVIKKGRVMLMLIVENLDEAREAVAFIRKHSRV
jgi:hypothetical protein